MAHENTTSIYLGPGTKEKLAALSEASGLSRSQVMRELIEQAGSENKLRMRELVAEMSELLSSTA
jgi:predicted DNA-binding protein